MPTSGSVNFNVTGVDVIKDALILIGGIEDEGTPGAAQSAYALRMLNVLVKAWSAKGLKAWLEQTYTLDLVSGTASYTLSAINRPLRIYDVRKVVDSVETPVRLVTRNEYMEQPSKDATGKPVFVYYDSQLSNGVLYVWPTPDDSTDDIKFSYRSYIEDFDSLTNDAHFPSEWYLALIYNLAVLLMPKYEVSGEDAIRIERNAAKFLMDAEDGDMEQGSLYIEPDIYES